jgi:hypothetical protein
MLKKHLHQKAIEIKQKILKLLGCGSRFGLILTRFVGDTVKNLLVIDHKTSEAIGGCVVPQSAAKAGTPIIEICDSNWLNGIDQSTIVDSLPILTLCSADSSLILVSFSPDGL